MDYILECFKLLLRLVNTHELCENRRAYLSEECGGDHEHGEHRRDPHVEHRELEVQAHKADQEQDEGRRVDADDGTLEAPHQLHFDPGDVGGGLLAIVDGDSSHLRIKLA